MRRIALDFLMALNISVSRKNGKFISCRINSGDEIPISKKSSRSKNAVNLPINKAVFAIATAVLLVGCGQEKNASPGEKPSSANTATAAAAASMATAAPQGSSSKPLSEYAELNSGRQLLVHFIARKDLSSDEWSRLAANSNPKIADESDAFKRQDMVKEFRASVEAQAPAAKEGSYVFVDFPDLPARQEMDAHLGQYDFDKKGFPVPFLMALPKGTRDSIPGVQQEDRYREMGFGDDRSVNLGFTNPKDFQFIKVADEALARTIEANRKKVARVDNLYYRPDLRLRAYIFINGAKASLTQGRSVTAQIMKLQLRDPQGKVLVEL